MLSALNAQKSRDLETAERLYRQALELFPDDIDALHMLGVVYFSKGELALAEKHVLAARRLCKQPIAAIEQNLRLVRDAIDLTADSASLRSMLEASAAQRRQGIDPLQGATLETSTRIIAFYLPQFHRIPENDAWWGEGFTEWVNVRRAKPNFAGHYQPHEPGELGYYDLSDEGILIRQADLARQYGISGFCFYHYWFSGRRLLEMPVERMLASGKPDFPYCLCWANENWTRNWDGGKREILVEQHYSLAEAEAFIASLLPHFRDPRYIRVGDRPLLMVYRLDLLPDPVSTVGIWRDVCRTQGLPPPYVVAAATFGNAADPRGLGADALADFPPHGVTVDLSLREGLQILEPTYTGRLADYLQTIAKLLNGPEYPYARFRGLVPSWDNTARRQLDGLCLLNSSPAAFELWLRELIFQASKKTSEERIVFVNAWNEWAEGCHLEPDRRYGRAWLQACLDARMLPPWYENLFGEPERPHAHARRPRWDGLAVIELDEVPVRSEFEDKGIGGDFKLSLFGGGPPLSGSGLLWEDSLNERIVAAHNRELVPPPLAIYSLENVALHGPGWMNRDNALLFSKDIYPEYCRDSHRSGSLAPVATSSINGTRRRRYRRGWHVTHYNCGVYGHWLLEVMPKLFAIRMALARWPSCSGMPIFMPTGFPRFVYEFCAQLLPEVPLLRYNINTEHIFADRLYMPSWGRAHVLNDGILDLLDRLPGEDVPEPHSLIYVSRRSLSGYRRLTNMGELEEIARAEGFAIVYPEDYSLFQQMTIFRAAKCIAGEYGSALHNALFAKQETVVLVLNWINPVQSRVARMRRQRVGYLLPTSGKEVIFRDDGALQNYAIDANTFRQRLRECKALVE